MPRGEGGSVTLVNGGDDGVVIADAVQFLPVDARGAEKKKKESPPEKADHAERKAALAALNQEIESRRKMLDAWKARAPKLATTMSVKEGEKTADIPIRIRGEVRNFGPVVPRGFLQVTMPPEAARPEIPEGSSGRRELAEWMASAENPLTARVAVNRIWLHLLGEGIVATPDNFGTTGRPPTHPDLLDYLARRFIDSDWSTKSLVRAIVLTKTYRLASDHKDAKALESDPENHLLWRARRRAVDAESLRDSLLVLAGDLDPDRGGPALPEKFKSEFGYRFTSKRRSVYIPVFRNNLHELFATFDFANPNFPQGRRARSNIPTQPLFLANSPFVHQQAEAAARQVLETGPKEVRDRIGFAYRRTLGRPPTASELALSEEFIQGFDHEKDPLAGWAALHRALFGSLDFRYLK